MNDSLILIGSAVSKLANKIKKNLDVLSSVGNFVAGVIDNYFYDGKLNGIIVKFNLFLNKI